MAFKLKLWHIAVIAILLIFTPLGTYVGIKTQSISLNPNPNPNPNPEPEPNLLAANLMFTLRQGIRDLSIASGASYVDICKGANGYFNFLQKSETVTVATDPDYSALSYNENDELVLHCSSDVDPATATGGENYDQWYFIKLAENAPIYKLDPSTMSKTQSGETVRYTSGNVNYWGLGNLEVTEKALGTTGVEMYLKYYATILSSVTDGAAWDDTYSEINANQTLPDDSEYLTFELILDDANNAFGLPIYTVGIEGSIQARIPVVIFSTSMTAIDSDAISDEGWVQINSAQLYAEKAWYHVIPSLVPTKGSSYGSWTVKIPIEAGSVAGSTAFVFRVWVAEGNTLESVRQGSVTVGLPTIYGFITEIGPDATHLDHLAFTTSSGAGATWCLYTYITTAA